MSNRTLVEVNHDYTPHNEESLLGRAKKFKRYLGSGEPKNLPGGVTYMGRRHHSEHGKMTPPCGWDNRAERKMIEHLSPDAIYKVIEYINNGGDDMDVVKSELGEMLLRANGKYWE